MGKPKWRTFKFRLQEIDVQTDNVWEEKHKKLLQTIKYRKKQSSKTLGVQLEDFFIHKMLSKFKVDFTSKAEQNLFSQAQRTMEERRLGASEGTSLSKQDCDNDGCGDEKNSSDDDDDCTRLENTADQKFSISEDNEKRLKMEKSNCKMRVAIDLCFDKFMTPTKVFKLASELRMIYNANSEAENPLQLYFCGMKGDIETLFTRVPVFSRINVYNDKRHFSNVFDKKDIVYLTDESPNVLYTLSEDKVYIIGGLTNIKPNITHFIADSHGVEHARFCIPETLSHIDKQKHVKVLAVDQAFMTLLLYSQNHDWKQTFECVAVKPTKNKRNNVWDQKHNNAMKLTSHQGTPQQSQRFRGSSQSEQFHTPSGGSLEHQRFGGNHAGRMQQSSVPRCGVIQSQSLSTFPGKNMQHSMGTTQGHQASSFSERLSAQVPHLIQSCGGKDNQSVQKKVEEINAHIGRNMRDGRARLKKVSTTESRLVRNQESRPTTFSSFGGNLNKSTITSVRGITNKERGGSYLSSLRGMGPPIGGIDGNRGLLSSQTFVGYGDQSATSTVYSYVEGQTDFLNDDSQKNESKTQLSMMDQRQPVITQYMGQCSQEDVTSQDTGQYGFSDWNAQSCQQLGQVDTNMYLDQKANMPGSKNVSWNMPFDQTCLDYENFLASEAGSTNSSKTTFSFGNPTSLQRAEGDSWGMYAGQSFVMNQPAYGHGKGPAVGMYASHLQSANMPRAGKRSTEEDVPIPEKRSKYSKSFTPDKMSTDFHWPTSQPGQIKWQNPDQGRAQVHVAGRGADNKPAHPRERFDHRASGGRETEIEVRKERMPHEESREKVKAKHRDVSEERDIRHRPNHDSRQIPRSGLSDPGYDWGTRLSEERVEIDESRRERDRWLTSDDRTESYRERSYEASMERDRMVTYERTESYRERSDETSRERDRWQTSDDRTESYRERFDETSRERDRMERGYRPRFNDANRDCPSTDRQYRFPGSHGQSRDDGGERFHCGRPGSTQTRDGSSTHRREDYRPEVFRSDERMEYFSAVGRNRFSPERRREQQDSYSYSRHERSSYK